VRERPPGTPVILQNWRDLLFLHWEYEAAEIERTLPAGLHADTFGGKAYIGVVPFFVRELRPPLLPALPFISDFLELNVRTYVYDEAGTPGIWFYTLDANHLAGVEAARLLYHLPYRYAKIEAQKDETTNRVDFAVAVNGVAANMSYRLRGTIQSAPPNSLEFFLIERYALFAANEGRLFTARVHHSPYPLCEAIVDEFDDRLFLDHGFVSPRRSPDHIIASTGVDVEVFAPQEVDLRGVP